MISSPSLLTVSQDHIHFTPETAKLLFAPSMVRNTPNNFKIVVFRFSIVIWEKIKQKDKKFRWNTTQLAKNPPTPKKIRQPDFIVQLVLPFIQQKGWSIHRPKLFIFNLAYSLLSFHMLYFREKKQTCKPWLSWPWHKNSIHPFITT